MKSTVQESLKYLTIDLIILEIRQEISKLLKQPGDTTEIRATSQFSPKKGLKSQLNLCTIDLGLLMKALERRYGSQFTLSTLMIREGEPIEDLSVEEIATFIYHQATPLVSAPLLSFRPLTPEAA